MPDARFDELVRIAPLVWPGAALAMQPSDLRHLAPMGHGLDVPLVMRPWDRLDGLDARQGYYSFHAHGGDPFSGAPVTEAAGGIVYFDGSPNPEDVAAVLRLMRVRSAHRSYAVFLSESSDPVADRYLVQVRIATDWALGSVYRAATGGEAASFVEQSLTLGDAVWAFIEDQQERWGTGMSYELRGAMGGDGDWAKEALAFGFMVENGAYGVYRLWTRAYLVTK